jgi:hypothetical protein
VFFALDVVQSQLQARKLGGMASTQFRLLEASDSVFPEPNRKLPDNLLRSYRPKVARHTPSVDNPTFLDFD